MPSLRIAQLMASGPIVGGLEKHFVDLCAGLAAEHQLLAIADSTHAASLPTSIEYCPLDFSSSRRNPLTLMRVHRLLRSFRPDVIHAHANKAAAIVATLRHFHPAKRVATVHGLKNSNRVFGSFDSVICVSSAVQKRVALPGSLVIRNGIHPPRLPACDPRYFVSNIAIGSERPVVVTAGRLAPVKGYAGLIHAWQGVDADLVIAGDGPQRPELVKLVHRLGLGESVHLVGFRTDVLSLMAHADMVVISSEREGFPYAMVEALHLEKIIVSTRFPGAEDLLPERFLVPFGDERQLHDLIVGTLSQLDESRSAFVPAWRHARAELTVARVVEQTGRVYKQLLSQAA